MKKPNLIIRNSSLFRKVAFCFGIMSSMIRCDAPDPTGPAASARIQLTATRDRVPADGLSTTIITATVKDERGEDASGPIYWSATCGSMDRSSDTMSGGVSTLTLTAPNFACQSVVTADAVHAKKSITIEFYSIDAERVTVSANPRDIPADGVSRSTITASVLKADNLPVEDGTTVSFSTTGGVLSSDTATTSSGKATVTLQSETVPKEALITATVGSASGNCRVRFYSTQIGRLVLLANPPSGIPADGVSTSIITATVYDVNSNLVEDGTTVYFTSTWGSMSASSSSTVKGIATVILKGYTESDYDPVARVTAVSGDKSAGIDVYFKAFEGTPAPTPTDTPFFPFSSPTPTPPAKPTSTPSPVPVYTLQVTANPISIPVSSGASTITVHLQLNGIDVFSDYVYLSTTNGSINSGCSVSDGYGYATLSALNGTAGEARITGQAHGISDTIIVEFTE